MDGLIFQIIIFAVLFAVGWGFGRHNERQHLLQLAQQEQRLAYIRLDISRFKQNTAQGYMSAAMW